MEPTTDNGVKKKITLTMDPDVHRFGQKLAKRERRNFSSYVEWLIATQQDPEARSARSEPANQLQ